MIKQASIIAFIFIQPFLFFAQMDLHYEELDAKWHVAETYPAANQQDPTFVATTTMIYGFQGDTTINGELWNKLYMTNDSLFQNNLTYVGATLVDNDQVLLLDTLNQLDTLYDFSLNIGDSVLYNINGTNQEWLDVIAIDSIQLNGSYYKRFHFDEPVVSAFDVLDEVWIEGIGSIHGPLFPKYPRKFSSEIPDSMLLTCSFASNQQVWQHPNYSNCYVNKVWGLHENEYMKVTVAPNPFNNKIAIHSPHQRIRAIAIFNQLGEELKVITDYTSDQNIDLSKLKPGIYFLKIQGKQDSSLKRIMKY